MKEKQMQYIKNMKMEGNKHKKVRKGEENELSE